MYGNFQRPALTLLLAVATTSCAANVLVEDDDGASNGANGANGATTSTGGGGGTGSGGGAASPDPELVKACDEWCHTACSTVSRYCARDCAALAVDCEAEMLAYIACSMPGETGPCPEDADEEACGDELLAVYACQIPLECGVYNADTTCEPPGESLHMCDCTSQCEEGHAIRQACSLTESNDQQRCECYFDGAFVGECQQGIGWPECFGEWPGHCCNTVYGQLIGRE